jgi:hypothetical protein
MEKESKSELIEHGWKPSEATALINFAMTVLEKKWETGPKECRGPGMERRSMSYTVGEVAACWRAPMSSEYAEKPKVFERSSFQRWVRYQAWLRSSELKQKNQYVTGNLACQTLYHVSTRLHPKVLKGLLEKAHVFVDFYVSGKAVSKFLRTPKPFTYSVDVPVKSLNPKAKVFVPKVEPVSPFVLEEGDVPMIEFQGGIVSVPKIEVKVPPISHAVTFPQFSGIFAAAGDLMKDNSLPELIVAYTSLVVGVFSAGSLESLLSIFGLYFTGVGKVHAEIFSDRI